jgi:alanyl-tRNA synthetase
VRRTGDIGFFKIVRDEALSAGVRRIEAVAHEAALDWVEHQEKLLRNASTTLRISVDELPERISGLIEERRRLERDLAETRRKLATGGGAAAGPQAKDVNGVKFASRVLEDVPPKDLKSMADEMKKQVGSGVVTVISVTDGKASIVVGVTEDLTGRISAVDLVRAGSAALGGKGGGGRADMAQAGGPNGAAANDAVTAIEQSLAG